MRIPRLSLLSRLGIDWFQRPAARRRKSTRDRRRGPEFLERRVVLTATLDKFVTTEHTDLASSYSTENGWSLSISEGIQGALSPEEALIYVSKNAKVTRPASSDWDFTGVASGEDLYHGSQVEQPGVLYLGANSYNVPGALLNATNPSVASKGRFTGLAKWGKYSLVGVEHTNPDGTPGDGVFSAWVSGTFGAPTVLLSSHDDGVANPNGAGLDTTDGVSADDAWWLLNGGHAHYNFGFSKLGRYEVQFQLSADFVTGGVIASDPVTVYFSVGSVSQLEFDMASYQVAENGGSATIDVRRVGGSDGRITVNHATADGSAIAGADYTAANETLTFHDGETVKQVSIPILDDAESELDETVLLSLANPGPATIVDFLDTYEDGLLGARAAATLTIVDNDCGPHIAGLTRGHADIGLAFEDGAWDLHVHVESGEEEEGGEEEHDHGGLEYAPEEILIQVGAASESTVPADPNFAFLGALPGATIFVLPTVEDPALPFLGFATEEIAAGTFVDGVKLKLKSVTGPGEFSLWSTDSLGVPTAHMATSDGVTGDDMATLAEGAHAHFNMAFTQAGEYAVTFEAMGELAAGGAMASSGDVTYYFAVNNGAAPEITLSETSQTYTEQAAPRYVDSTSATVVDADSANFAGGRVRVDIALGGHPDDVLAIRHQGAAQNQISLNGANVAVGLAGGGTVVIGTFTGGSGGEPLVVSLNENATAARVTRLLRAITFHNASDDPGDEHRLVRFVVSDGDCAIGDAVIREVEVTPVNDRTVVVASAGAASHTENEPPTIVDSLIQVSDPDSADFDGGSLTVSIPVNRQSTDRLTIVAQGNGTGEVNLAGSNVLFEGVVIGAFTGGFTSSVPLVVNFNANANAAAVQQVARRVAFHNVSENPSGATRTVRFVVKDGDGGTSMAANKQVSVTPVNDRPSITNLGAAIDYTQNAPPAVIAGAALVADPDSPNFAGGSLRARFFSGGIAADRIGIRNQGAGNGRINLAGANVTYGVGGVAVVIGTVTGGVGTAPLVVSLNENATVAAVRALVRNITFHVVGNTPTSTRTVRFTLNDGDGGVSAGADKQIQVIGT